MGQMNLIRGQVVQCARAHSVHEVLAAPLCVALHLTSELAGSHKSFSHSLNKNCLSFIILHFLSTIVNFRRTKNNELHIT